MRILFAGGGTAGHINPALAIAGYVKKQMPEAEILFVGNKGGMEERLVPQAGFDFKQIVISGFKRSFNVKAIGHNLKTVKRMFTASAESKKIIKEFKPDLAVGTGGYVSGPVLRTAAKMGVPIIIHEQNAYPGVTTKMLSKLAKKVMLAIPDAKKHLDPNLDYVITGNPVRQEILSANRESARAELGLDERPVVLSFGGSLGARKINENLADLIARSGKDGKYQHIHAYGQYGKWFPDLVKEKGTDISKCPNLDIREYINIINDINIVIIPRPPTIFNGFVEKLIIPSEASFIIFFNGYFVFPANLSCLSYSKASCLNPTQLNKPLKNLLCSGIEFITSTTFLSTSLKSPVSLGISTSDNAFNVL